jgi:hypothetical protein
MATSVLEIMDGCGTSGDMRTKNVEYHSFKAYLYIGVFFCHII